jgi:hypothetical protein
MKTIVILVILIMASISLASAYTAEQQAMIDGTSLSWKMAIAYDQQNIPEFNALADQWNAWVRQHFGEDPNLLMNVLTGPVDLQKPYVAANNTTSAIIHKIDGNRAENKTYTTNDMNLLPASVTEKMYNDLKNAKPGSAEAMAAQGNYLGGI